MPMVLSESQFLFLAVYKAKDADDVLNKDIHPKSVSIVSFGEVIDDSGKWVGDPTGLQGPKGDTGATGPLKKVAFYI
ncbi:MAG: hypothetical protein ACE5PV_25900 [Candidatus Poribacteria bacterium]